MTRARSKRRAHWAAYLWPGLAHLWISGSLAGLVLAMGFTFLVNVWLLSLMVWPEWLSPRLQLVCGATIAGLWLAALVETRAELRRVALRKEAEDQANEMQELQENQPKSFVLTDRKPDAQLCLAQRQYLAADWVAAERTLQNLLKDHRDDIPAQLLLAGVHRRMGRPSDALRRLRRLSMRDEAASWNFEIDREIRQLERAASPLQTGETPRLAA